MSETKYGKNIITELLGKTDAPWDPVVGPDEIKRGRFLDNSVVEGAFYVETNWTLPPFAKKVHGESHTHDYDEVLGFFGGDSNNPDDLNAEAEVHIGGEIHKVIKSCLIYVPKGTPHGPIVFNRIDKPMFHFSCGVSKKYY